MPTDMLATDMFERYHGLTPTYEVRFKHYNSATLDSHFDCQTQNTTGNLMDIKPDMISRR